MVFLSVHPERLDLALQSVRENLKFIDRIVVLTKPDAREAIAAIAARHFPQAVVLTDDAVAGAGLPADHQARNTWLRKHLYAQPAIEANFLAADEDSLALRPLDRAHYQSGTAHTGYYFQEDMATWLAGSPAPTSFDRGMRNIWRALAEAAYPTRAYASHMPQIVNKSLVNEIFDRFVTSRDAPPYDEWSLYFNVAEPALSAAISERSPTARLAGRCAQATGCRSSSCSILPSRITTRRIMRRPKAACS